MLVELFKTEKRARILRYVMLRTDFTAAEVSRATRVNKGLVSRYLRYLAERGLVMKNERRYFTLDGAISRAVKIFLNLEKIDVSALSLGAAKSLGIFGSWAKGTNRQDSDLDVWIEADSMPLEIELAKLQRNLSLQAGAEVNLLVLTPEKLEKIKREDPPFFNSLVLSSVTLVGEPLEDYR
jgi:predicted nucleotidyltransferase